MKTCLRLTLFMCLLLPPLLTSAARDTVRVNASCTEGNAFTIRIPVKIPAGMSVEYVWYRNDTAVVEPPPIAASTTRTTSVTAIAHTVPAGEAYGSAAYHFMYRLNGDCRDCWSLSPRYMVSFLPACPPSPGAIDDGGCTGIAVAGTIDDGVCIGIISAGSIKY